MTFDAYPLQFEPILKENIWGGTKLKTELGKKSTSPTTGESWEISAVDNSVSKVTNGVYANQSLTKLIDDFPQELLGTSVYKRFGKQFPLLLKFIDSKMDLSIQVHPSDELAKKRHNSLGKTEMWYIMQADPGAKIIVGFNQKASGETYLAHLQANTLDQILEHVEVKQGEVFFLETGTVHSIGAGILLAEIQQSSDITYRIYDFDRVGADGKKRELHVDQALDAITYDQADSKREYTKEPNLSNPVADCEYFTTNYIPLDGEISKRFNKDTFRVYMCVEGQVRLTTKSQSLEFKKGQTVLIPAALTDFTISGNASLLEIYIS